MRILVTDVTEMWAGDYCVAGWCAQSGRMVRPLPEGFNWTARLLAQGGVAPSVEVDMQRMLFRKARADYPHKTEDTCVRKGIRAAGLGRQPWFGVGAPPAALTLAEAFENNVRCDQVRSGWARRAHVPAGARTRSLWAIVVPRQCLRFFEEGRKLRGLIDDGRAKFELPVSSRELKVVWRTRGLPALNLSLPRQGELHVRLGLARPLGAAGGKCHVMINGVYW
jgi:hypothetical protein